MTNKNEIIAALRCAASPEGVCKKTECPYYAVEDAEAACDTDQLMIDAAALMESDGWIPCSVRLPEAGEWVRVTIELPDGKRGIYDTCYNGEYWNYVVSAHVIAWRPRIEPYKGGESK